MSKLSDMGFGGRWGVFVQPKEGDTRPVNVWQPRPTSPAEPVLNATTVRVLTNAYRMTVGR